MWPSGELPDGDPGGWARARRLQGAHATGAGEEDLHDGRRPEGGEPVSSRCRIATGLSQPRRLSSIGQTLTTDIFSG